MKSAHRCLVKLKQSNKITWKVFRSMSLVVPLSKFSKISIIYCKSKTLKMDIETE